MSQQCFPTLHILPAFYVSFAVAQTVVFVLLIRLVDHYEHEPMSLLGIMVLWGAVGATAISLILNPWIKGLLPSDVNAVFGSAIAAPIAEEVSKGLALVGAFGFAFWAHRRFGVDRLEGVTDGIVYGAAVGLGFAFTEDVQYFLNGQNIQEFLCRRDFFGLGSLHHAVFTAAFGVGLGMIVWARRRGMRLVWPLAGLAVAIILHAVNNGLTNVVLAVRYGTRTVASYIAPQTFGALSATLSEQIRGTESRALIAAWIVDYAIFVGAFLGVWFWLHRQRKVIARELLSEAGDGLISPLDLELAPRYWRRASRYVQLLREGEFEGYRVMKALHIELANLAFLKWQASSGGMSDSEDVEHSRERVRRLRTEEAYAMLVDPPVDRT